MKIPLVDLTPSTKKYKKEITKKFKKILDANNFILGKEVEEFEKSFANYLDAQYCIGVATGTDALLLSIKALEIGEGDEVIVPSMTFIATALAVIHAGATPVLVDVTADTHLIDPTKVEAKITKKTKAIIPVHLYGHPCDMDTINKIAKKHKLFVIEDACQAHGSLYNKKCAGTLSDVAGFSFYPGKNLGAFGDAGAVVTSNKKIADKVFLLRNYGAKEKYVHYSIGYNSRMDSVQAAVLSVKLKGLDRLNKKRRAHARLYAKLMKDFPIELPIESENIQTNYHLYAIQVKKRDALMEYLKNNGVYCGIHYPLPLHLQPALAYLKYKKGDFPNAEKIASQTLSLPMYPEMTNLQIEYIAKKINNFLLGK